MCSFYSTHGKHLVLLGVSFLGASTATFRSTESGSVSLHVRNDSLHAEKVTVLAAVGDSFEAANASVMYQARDLVGPPLETGDGPEQPHPTDDDVKAEWYENWYDGLGYCTWNGLGQNLTEERVIEAVDQLAKHDINITSLIIDDNWQDNDRRGSNQFQRGWRGFEAESTTFPGGLKRVADKIRARHSSILHVTVWHAMLGYWGGISPDGPIANKYKTVETPRVDANPDNMPLEGKMTVIAADDVDQYYDDFYRFLRSAGIDAVKTDVQYMMETWTSASARRSLIRAYLDAWHIASARHFGIRSISCMSQSPGILFYSQMARGRPAMPCRNSDDFFPDVPASHPWHVWANAHNSLLTQHLNVLPDWDMFQTGGSGNDFAGFHAAARCVSGGPIYITDVPGQHDVGLIRQMTAETIRGQTVVLRPSVIGRSLDQYVSYHDNRLLKVGSYNGRAETGTPILGLFNVSSTTLTELIPLSKLAGVLSTVPYLVRAHTTGRIASAPDPARPATSTASSPIIAASLGVHGYEIFTAYPVTFIENVPISVEKRGERKEDMAVWDKDDESQQQGSIRRISSTHGFANLGLVGKMTGAAAILSSNISRKENNNGRVIVETKLKALGVWGIYISSLPYLSLSHDFIATIQNQPIPPHTAAVSATDPRVLEIDTAQAWREMGLSSGWSNEVQIKLYVNPVRVR